jgi:hypothetical protein
MNDPFDILERHLVRIAEDLDASAAQGARRVQSSAQPRRRRWLALSLTCLAVSGSAAAAVVAVRGHDSKPLSGPLPPAHTSEPNHYRLEVFPDLTAGANGWCFATSMTRGTEPATSGLTCARAPRGGKGVLAGGLAPVSSKQGLFYLLVDRSVEAVLLHDGRTVRSRPASGLPSSSRVVAATVPVRNYHLDSPYSRFTILSHTQHGQTKTSTSLQALSRRGRLVARPDGAPADPACNLRSSGTNIELSSLTTLGRGTARKADAVAFFACATATVRYAGARFHAAVLMGLVDAGAPAVLPGMHRRADGTVDASGGVSARRLRGGGWLAVTGGDATQRRTVISRLQATIHR